MRVAAYKDQDGRRQSRTAIANGTVGKVYIYIRGSPWSRANQLL